jgi:hypothetical protein
MSQATGDSASTTASRLPLPGRGARGQTDCGEFGIKITRDGTWWYQNSPIGRLALVKLFATVLRREADGSYWLVTPIERGRITVEDAPFAAVELTVAGAGREQVLTFRTNLDDSVSAGADHPIRIVNDAVTGAPNPYILMRDGLEARLTRSVFYQLVEIGREERVGDTARYGVWSKGKFFEIGTLDAIG